MTWIRTVVPEVANGALAALYQAVAKARGGVAAIHVAQSLHPRALRAHLELYKSIVLAPGALPRRTREAIAVVVSRTNGCAYCARHHAAALASAGESAAVVTALLTDTEPDLHERERRLLDWARRATARPALSSRTDLDALRALGWDDAAILDAALVVSYFCFVNRLVLLLGVELEDGFEDTCR